MGLVGYQQRRFTLVHVDVSRLEQEHHQRELGAWKCDRERRHR